MRKVEDKLQEIGATRPEQRRAHFVSALTLAIPGAEPRTFVGRVDGTLVWPPRGKMGFGYDPMFLPDGHDRTFGEMTAEEKHGWRPGQGEPLSHRARAFRLFARDCLAVA
jgi:XTP/dITP diphosphohydrolase